MEELSRQAQSAVSDLLESDEDQLLEQLGIRAKAIQANPAVSASFQPAVVYEATTMGVMDDVKELGRRIFKRWNREAYKLVCGGEDIDKKDREELAKAFGLGDAAVAGVIASLLISSFGVAPAIATVVAALVIKRFFRPAYDEFCELWKEKLPAES